MKNHFWAALLALILALPQAGAALTLEPHAGYTSLSMGELNQSNHGFYGWWAAGKADTIDSGVLVGVDMLQTVPSKPWLELGLRGEWLQSNLAEIWVPETVGTFGYSDQAWLSSLLVGGRASQPFAVKGLSLSLGAWLGAGYAALQQNVTNTKETVGEGLYTGHLIVGELEAGLRYSLPWGLTAAFTGGWRWANAGPMFDDRHHALGDANTLDNGSGDIAPVDVDYSGITAQGSVSYSF